MTVELLDADLPLSQLGAPTGAAETRHSTGSISPGRQFTPIAYLTRSIRHGRFPGR